MINKSTDTLDTLTQWRLCVHLALEMGTSKILKRFVWSQYGYSKAAKELVQTEQGIDGNFLIETGTYFPHVYPHAQWG